MRKPIRTITQKLKWIAPALALLGWLCAAPAHAWNGTGHMAVAGIAYDHLTPKTKAAVDALLMRQKDYGLWISEMPAGYTDKARFAFMKAATWPDDIRKTPEDRPIWHFIDLPVIAPGYTPDPIALLPVKPNAETQIGAETTLLSSPTATDGERAIALCWVEHLVGDIHQPLHTASLYSPAFPKGDRGGNSENLSAAQVKDDPIEKEANPKRLHALWDDLEGTTNDPAEVQKIVTSLETPAYSRKAFPQITSHPTVHEWIVESNILAKQDGYLNGTLSMTPAGEGKEDVTLPRGYIAEAHKIGSQQVALAGLRLADLLNAQTYPAVTAAPVPALPPAPTPPAAPAAAAPADTAAGQGPIVGNKRSHVYHLPGGGRLPAEANRVYFQTEAEAQAAGYHKSGR